MDLINKKCIPCEVGGQPLSGGDAQRYLAELNTGWAVIENKKIKKEFKFKDFKQAMVFVNRVAEVAEAEGHHPDIALSWGKVKIILFTHSVGGLTENDFILASKIDELG